MVLHLDRSSFSDDCSLTIMKAAVGLASIVADPPLKGNGHATLILRDQSQLIQLLCTSL